MVLTRVGVTGASGMVGRHVLSFLASQGVSQCTTSRKRPEKLPEKTAWSSWDLTEWKDDAFFDLVFPKVDAVFHVGAMVPLDFGSDEEETLLEANVRSCMNLGLWALRKDIPVVFLSGAIVYKDIEKRGILESDERLNNAAQCIGGFYGYSKLMAEDVFFYLASRGLKVSVLRPSSIYGTGLPESKMISKFLRAASAGETIQLVPPVDDQVNLIHAFDVAKAMWQACLHEAWGVYNIGEGMYSVLDVAQTCVTVVGRGKVEVLRGNEMNTGKNRFDLNDSKARSDFEFRPCVSLSQGLALIRSQSTLLL